MDYTHGVQPSLPRKVTFLYTVGPLLHFAPLLSSSRRVVSDDNVVWGFDSLFTKGEEIVVFILFPAINQTRL